MVPATETALPAPCKDGHCWTWTYDTGNTQHCDDCGIVREDNLGPEAEPEEVDEL